MVTGAVICLVSSSIGTVLTKRMLVLMRLLGRRSVDLVLDGVDRVLDDGRGPFAAGLPRGLTAAVLVARALGHLDADPLEAALTHVVAKSRVVDGLILVAAVHGVYYNRGASAQTRAQLGNVDVLEKDLGETNLYCYLTRPPEKWSFKI